jgi:signal transduction histidine kinase/ligand-binding sensor domain-containing protein/DNA-binding response OmpR family regulator
MKKRRLLISIIWIISTIQVAYCGTFSFRHYTVEDGLVNNSVTNAIQDKRGFMWFATGNGLVRFDGTRFKGYYSTGKGKNAMTSNKTTCVFEEPTGSLWVGTDMGIYIFSQTKEAFVRFDIQFTKGNFINSAIYKITSDRSGYIWISTWDQGVFSYNTTTKKLKQYTVFVDKLSFNHFDRGNDVYVDCNNNVWVASSLTTNPILRYDRTNDRFYSFPVKINDLTILSLYEDSHHNFWLGTWNNGICKLNTKSGEILSYLSPKKPDGILHIRAIKEYRSGVLLIGSDDGLVLLNTTTLTHQLFRPKESDPASISGKFIYSICNDREGGFWICTNNNGINYLSPNSGFFGRYSHSSDANSIGGNVIGRFAEDKQGNIWIATDDGGLNVLNKSTGLFSTYLPKKGVNSISYHDIHALCWDDDLLWIGTYSGGLNVLNIKTGKFKVYNTSKNVKTLDGGSIFAIFKDDQKRIWVTSMWGVNLYNRETDDFTRIKRFNATTIDIKQDKKGFLWFATQGKGVFRLDPFTQKWKNYCTDLSTKSVSSNNINCISFDSANNMWIGTANGLCVYDSKNDCFNPVSTDIPNQIICSIVADKDNLWLTTTNGLIRYNPSTKSNQIFTRGDGLLSNQFIENSMLKSLSGTIYIGTSIGFNTFTPSNLKQNKHIPSVVITGLEIFNKEVEVGENSLLKTTISNCEKIDLSYKDNDFSLNFVALSYATPEKNKYAYKLEGFDNNWNVVSYLQKATYTNLPYGEYVFRVKASNNDGLWNEQGAAIKIVVHPPFWLSTGFKLIYFILVIIMLIILLRRTRLRAERKHNDELKELKQQKEKEVYNAKIEFFTMIAHEIRTPVSLIIGPLEKILTILTTLPEFIRNDLNIIDRNSQRLLQLVNQLLDFRKIEQGSLVLNYSRQNIYQLLCNISERFKPMMEQNHITFTLDCSDKNFEGIIDVEAITKVISNLMTNALKFTDNEITLMCDTLPQSDTFEILVRDNGNGISNVEKDKIFTPFYQIPSGNKQGTGIGLSLVKNIAEAHQGNVKITDSPRKGATFILTLPQRTNEKLAVDEISESNLPIIPILLNDDVSQIAGHIGKWENNRPILLIVEDNIDMRSFLSNNLNSYYQVLTADDGIEGLEQLEKNEVSLIISDLMMPRMNGLEFCKAVKSNILLSHIPFVLLTARTDLDTKIEGLNFGADSYIEKPFSVNHLNAQINNLIESRFLLRKKYSEVPFSAITTIASNAADEHFLTRLNEIIEQNISNEEFSIDQLTDALVISRSGLFTKIKSLAGVTPNELIQIIRLKKAAEYISKHEYRINEIVYMVGFKDPSYFSKCFQKQFGLRPVEFSRKYTEKSPSKF